MLKKRKSYNVIYLIRGKGKGLIQKNYSGNLRCSYGLEHLLSF